MPNDVNLIRSGSRLHRDLMGWQPGQIDSNGLLRCVLALQRQVGADELAVVRVPDSHPMVDWSSFPAPKCSLPGADVGQLADWRYSVTDGSGLHLQRFQHGSRLFIDAHVDSHDACTLPIEHAAHSTRAFEYGAICAAAAGLLTYLVTGSGKAAVGAAIIGASGGGLAGAHTPKQRRVVVDLAALIVPSGGWRVP